MKNKVTVPDHPTPETLINHVVQAVAELPDRTSPDDWPDAMLVTADELRAILQSALAGAVSHPQPEVKER